MRKTCALLAAVLSVCFTASAQSISLNPSGLIKNPPPKHFYSGKSFSVTITGEDTYSKAELEEVEKRLRFINIFLNQATKQELEAESLIKDAYIFLKNNSSCMPKYADTLKKHYGICLTKDYVSKLDTQIKDVKYIAPNCNSEACLCMTFKRKLAQWGEAEKIIEEGNRKRELIYELLCDKSNQTELYKYQSEGRNGSGFHFMTRDTSLHPDFILSGNNYYLDEKPLSYNFSQKSFFGEKEIDKKVQFNVSQIKGLNKTLLEWHNESVKQLNVSELRTYSKLIESSANEIETLSKHLNCNETCDAKGLKALGEKLAIYDSVWCPTSSISIWLKRWLWFSGGEFKLYYFNFTSPDLLKHTTKYLSLNEFDSQEKRELQELQDKIQSLKNCLTCTYESLDTLQKLQVKEAELRKKIPASLKAYIDKNQNAFNSFSQITTVLHSFKLPANGRKDHIIHHNAQEEYELATNKKVILPDDRTVYFGIYNAKKQEDDKLEFVQTKAEFKDNGRFVQEMTESFKELTDAATLLSPFYPKLDKFLDATIGNHKVFERKTTIEKSSFINFLFEKVDSNKIDTCEDVRQELKKKYWRWQLLKKMLEEYQQMPTPALIEATKNEQPKYFTYVRKASEWEPAYTNKYIVKQDGKEKLANKYSIGRQRYFGIGAGLLFNQKTARQVSVDTAGNSFKITNRDEQAKFVIGLKFYPAKSFAADDGLWPRYFLKRLSVFTGFELTKPLENLYGGIGYDIVPGLHITGGVHYYRRDVFTVQNNQVLEKSSYYKASGLYTGVTLDPAVLAGILKALIL